MKNLYTFIATRIDGSVVYGFMSNKSQSRRLKIEKRNGFDRVTYFEGRYLAKQVAKMAQHYENWAKAQFIGRI